MPHNTLESADMQYTFTHSLVVMGQLARDVSRTPPSEDDRPFEYVDRSLENLGWAFDVYSKRIQQEFRIHRDFIVSMFLQMESKLNSKLLQMELKINLRFEEMEKSIDRRFAGVDRRFEAVERRIDSLEEKMDRRFDQVDRRFDQVDRRFQDIQVQLDNAAALTKNGRLRRMHQPINLIKKLRPSAGDFNKLVWASHPQVPKHMRGLFALGQRAKGDFDPSWDGKSKGQKAAAKEKALDTITQLAKFYEVTVWSDEASESDATEVILQPRTVDDYMEALLDEWGMDWPKVVKLGTQLMQTQPQQIATKRAGDGGSGAEAKKVR